MALTKCTKNDHFDMWHSQGSKQNQRTVNATAAIYTRCQFSAIFIGYYTTLWKTFISTYQASALFPLWLLSFTGCYIMRVSLKVKLLRFPGFPGNVRSLSPWLEGRINKPSAAIAMLMSISLMSLHVSLVVPRCHCHVSEDPCGWYSCVNWTSRKYQHLINYLH